MDNIRAKTDSHLCVAEVTLLGSVILYRTHKIENNFSKQHKKDKSKAYTTKR